MKSHCSILTKDHFYMLGENNKMKTKIINNNTLFIESIKRFQLSPKWVTHVFYDGIVFAFFFSFFLPLIKEDRNKMVVSHSLPSKPQSSSSSHLSVCRLQSIGWCVQALTASHQPQNKNKTHSAGQQQDSDIAVRLAEFLIWQINSNAMAKEAQRRLKCHWITSQQPKQ